jgi:hypothetical protein
LILTTSTWGKDSFFGRWIELLCQMLAEFPQSRYRIAMLLHPNVWYGHGVWQVRNWLADCQRDGVILVPPTADWRGPLVAADHVIGDHGSIAVYASVTGASILLTGEPGDGLDPESAGGVLAEAAPRLRPDRSLRVQLREAAGLSLRCGYPEVVGRLTSEPGRFDRNLRRLMYRLMHLRQPASIPRVEPVPPPHLTFDR